MARKGENIYKRKDGRWEARYIYSRREDGKAVYKSVYASTYSEVRRKKAEALRQLSELDNEWQKEVGKLTSVAVEWMNCNSHTWKESTKCRYQEKLDVYILPRFGKCEMSDISTKEVEDFMTLLQTEGYNGRKPLGSSSASTIMTIMRQLRKQALKSDCRVRFSGECITIRKRKAATDVISEGDEKLLVSSLMDDVDETSAGILTSLFTGIRIGELCALKCEDIDMDRKVIHIRSTMQRIKNTSIEAGAPKTKITIDAPKSDCAIRDIPLSDNLIEIIRPFVKPGTFFLTGDAEHFVEPRTFENRYKAILKKYGLKKMGYHSTRRTFASRCIERGMDPKTLSEILGHASVSTTLDLYVHINIQKRAEGMEMLSDLFAV